MIEGLREGGRQFTYGDLRRRADRMAVGARARSACGAGDVVSWQLPNWFEGAALAAAIDRIGAVSNPIITIYREREVAFVCRQARAQGAGRARRGARRRPSRARARGAARRRPISSTCSPCAPRPPPASARSRRSRTTRARRCRRRRSVRTTSSMIFYTSGTTADPKGVLHTPSTLGAVAALPRAALPAVARRSQPAAVPAHAHRRPGDVRHAADPLGLEHRSSWRPSIPTLAIDLIERHGVTSAGGPPAILQAHVRGAELRAREGAHACARPAPARPTSRRS